MCNYRKEKDSIGTMNIPQDAYYGIHSMRARNNFFVTGSSMHPLFIDSIVIIKKAAAITNCEVGMLSNEKTTAIVTACNEILSGRLRDSFIEDPIQGGAGTSFNMNANEVIANRAIEILDGKKGNYDIIHPNDDVNCGQSTNDVILTAGKMTTISLIKKLKGELCRLHKTLRKKGEEFDNVIKMGRTQMQDAVPIRLGQEFYAYAEAILRNIRRLDKAIDEMRQVNLGGTAIGTGLNTNIEYYKKIVPNLRKLTGIHFIQASDMIDATQNMDPFVAVSGSIKACAVTLSKIANDLRLMSSGPNTGLSEINLPARQNGSSIMPGKVNPVIPEVVNQVAFYVIGNDTSITLACGEGQLELNPFGPIIFYCMYQSLDTLTYAIKTFNDNCIVGITANEERCRYFAENSTGLITALCPHIGYQAATEIAKKAIKTGVSVKDLMIKENILSRPQIEEIMDPKQMTEPGIVEIKGI